MRRRAVNHREIALMRTITEAAYDGKGERDGS